MAKLPEPPSPLELDPEIAIRERGARCWRIYFAGGRHPATWRDFRFFGPTLARFDHHDPPPSAQARGILYTAASPVTCLAEVFQATRVIDRGARSPWLVAFDLARDVPLLDLTGPWPTRAGASMAIGSGPRPRARRWSRAIYEAYANVEGLLYASSMNANRPALALYERAHTALPAAPVFHRALSDPALVPRLNAAATALGYRLV
ncbi:MAG: RES family NAD+ phosphorylase [Polyangiaceae bacterium]